jgi:hypothetical protein
MAKNDVTDPATEIKDIIATGRKKSLNFALMKSKDGVVLKAHATKSSGVMQRECKAAGGLPAMQAQGILNVRGKLIEMTLEDPNVSDTLAKLAKKYFSSLGIPCKIAFLLPGGESLGDKEDDDDAVAGGPKAEDRDDAPNDATAPRRQSDQSELAPGTVAANVAKDDNKAADDPIDALQDVLMKEFETLAPQITAAKTGDRGPMAKKIGAIETMFLSVIGQDPKKARGVLELMGKTLKTIPGLGEAVAKPTRIRNRIANMEALEKRVDELLAGFA